MTDQRKKSAEKRLAEMMANPYDRSHGTMTGYKYGCRCTACGYAMSEHMREYYLKHKREIRAHQRRYYREHREQILEHLRTVRSDPAQKEYARKTRKRRMV